VFCNDRVGSILLTQIDLDLSTQLSLDHFIKVGLYGSQAEVGGQLHTFLMIEWVPFFSQIDLDLSNAFSWPS
jgi:hypothetical protein